MTQTSIFEHVLAPTPRYLMRLECIRRLLETYVEDVSSFLEIGPGLGDVSAYALQRYPHAKGRIVEFSEPAVNQLQHRFPDPARLSIHLHDFLEESTPARFDLVLAFEVLEHIEHDLAALQRIYSSLLPSGLFLMSVPAYMKKWQLGDEWAGHYQRYERDELQEKLGSTGFEIREVWSYGFPITSLLLPLQHIYYCRKLRSRLIPQDKQEASKQSGITRSLHAQHWSQWLAVIMRPLFLMQHAARCTGLGDGWIVLAQKPSH